MRQVVYLADATDNLREIQRFLRREAGLSTARDVVGGLRARCRRIASLPGTLGTDRHQFSDEMRSTPHGSYVIFFRYRDDAVEIVNILHASRDVDGYFSE
jgi:toxin ParE1/3/4